MSPSELSELCDAYWRTYQERLASDREAKELKSRETKLEAQLLQIMRKEELSAVGGNLVRLWMDPKPEYVPTIGDYPVFSAFVLESKDLSLLERRVSKSAVKERWELEVEVPGITRMPVFKLHKSQVK